MQSTTSRLASILTVSLFAMHVLAAPPGIEQMAWLAGCWKNDAAEAGTVEHWMGPAGGTMLGMGRTVKRGKTAEFEFMQLRTLANGELAFIATPSGQQETVFPLLSLSNLEVVFENLQHDFPQRVIYRRVGESKILARVEGTQDGALRSIEFPMSRISCDPQSRKD